MNATTLDGLLCWCRPGFEPELAAELAERSGALGMAGYARTERQSGVLLWLGEDGAALDQALPFRELIFARQKLRLLAELCALDPRDRITPMLAALQGRGVFGEVWVEHPDSEAGRPLAALARSFANALRRPLREHGMLTPHDDETLPRLHVCFLDGAQAWLASSRPGDSSPRPLGVPRLRSHADAPSRSALKLEEALFTLLDADERAQLLRPGMRAADLGAAPGGWSWILSRHGMQVSAIDNGPMADSAMASGLITHQRADGFSWQPAKSLDWMVCDMVEQPRRVATRMGEWFANGWCRQAIFNLKLPMKKRWLETTLCLDVLQQRAGRALTIRARQLYHDREEITVFAQLR